MAQDLYYRVVSSGSEGIFQQEVNKALSEGWTLHGSLVVMGSVLLQAMTKERPKESKPVPVVAPIGIPRTDR